MNDVVEKAAQEILEIGRELAKLQGAVRQHVETATALAGASEAVARLGVVLSSLPDPLNQSLERAESMVGMTERAMQPAGGLVTAVSALPSADVVKQLVSSAASDVSTQLRLMAGESNAKLGELTRRLEQFEQSTRTSLDGIASENKATIIALQKLTQKFEESGKQSRDKLDVLERLGRRSLFAILMGRDADQKRG